MARNARVLRDPTSSFWLITRYDDVDAILKDKRFGKKALPGTEHRLPFADRTEQRDRLAILNIDPPTPKPLHVNQTHITKTIAISAITTAP